jgi:tetratricopeptide (TPR) repeat protein
VDAVAAVSGIAPEEVGAHLRGLVRREMLTQEADPRSPERGQYVFVQGLVREVAYGTLAKADRRRLHLAAARYFETLDDEGIAGALAEHYVAAYRAQPDGPEGEAVAAQARVALRGAAERARSLGSFVQAMRFLERALEVTTDPADELALRAAAGDAAMLAGLVDEPIAHTKRALEMARELGIEPEGILHATVQHALALGINGRMAEDAALLEAARAEFPDLAGTRASVRMNAELARAYLLLTRGDDSLRIIDQTLPVAERHELLRETLELLVTRGAALAGAGRLREGTVTLVGAVSAASAAEIPTVELRGRVNLSYAAAGDDPQLAYRTARDGLALATRLGMRGYGYYLIGNATELALRMGEWDWALTELEEAVGSNEHDLAARMRWAELRGLRGDDTDAEFQRLAEIIEDWTEMQAQSATAESRAVVALARGDLRAALELAQRAYSINIAPDATSAETAIRAAAGLRDADAVADALRVLENYPGRVTAAIRREGEAVRAALAGRSKESLTEFLEAVKQWRELGLVFEVAMAQLTLVTVLGVADPDARAAVDEARAVFERLGAQPLLDRLDEAMRADAGAAPSRDADARLEDAPAAGGEVRISGTRTD